MAEKLPQTYINLPDEFWSKSSKAKHLSTWQAFGKSLKKIMCKGSQNFIVREKDRIDAVRKAKSDAWEHIGDRAQEMLNESFDSALTSFNSAVVLTVTGVESVAADVASKYAQMSLLKKGPGKDEHKAARDAMVSQCSALRKDGAGKAAGLNEKVETYLKKMEALALEVPATPSISVANTAISLL